MAVAVVVTTLNPRTSRPVSTTAGFTQKCFVFGDGPNLIKPESQTKQNLKLIPTNQLIIYLAIKFLNHSVNFSSHLLNLHLNGQISKVSFPNTQGHLPSTLQYYVEKFIKLTPFLSERLWGDQRLKTFGFELPENVRIGDNKSIIIFLRTSNSVKKISIKLPNGIRTTLPNHDGIRHYW